MNNFSLTKEKWQEGDISPFLSYLENLSAGEEASKREKQILCTNLPCIAVKSEEVNRIVKEICRGNYISFLDLWINRFWTNVSILGGVISKIKYYEIFERYLNKFALECDSWASTDCLKFNVNKTNEEKFFALAKEYLKSEKPFVRRIGIRIFFKFILNEKYLDEIFDILKMFKNEDNYYVNMALAWFVCECFIKRRDKALWLLKSGLLNDFVQNKAISKCRDSFRVSKEDKEMLISLRR